VDAVLSAIYGAYGSGWDRDAGVTATSGLVDEAIWLARVSNELLPDVAEVGGLLALMLHCEARRGARRAPDGRFIPLSEQDPRLWNAAMIEEAEQELAHAAALAQPGRFQLEAAIQSVHAERARTGQTNWRAIALLYEGLVRIAPTLGACVARAAVVAEVDDAESGLHLLDAIEPVSIARYQPYWAVRAHLLEKTGRNADAAHAFERAIELAADPAVQRFLQQQRDKLPR
jgi:RNA polymerase sigma-70 factor (ECF subfamily)